MMGECIFCGAEMRAGERVHLDNSQCIAYLKGQLALARREAARLAAQVAQLESVKRLDGQSVRYDAVVDDGPDPFEDC